MDVEAAPSIIGSRIEWNPLVDDIVSITVRMTRTIFALMVFVSAGCTRDGLTSMAEPVPTDTPCLAGIEWVEDPPTDYETVLGVVALPPGVLSTSLSATRNVHWAKSGLLVKAGEAFRIEVVADQETRVTIGWGALEGDHVEGHACGDDGWIAMAGGYEVDEPRCVDLQITDGSEIAEFGVGVGVSC